MYHQVGGMCGVTIPGSVDSAQKFPEDPEKGRWYPVVGGKKGPDYDSMAALVLSPDGTEVAFRTTRGVVGPAFVMKGAWKSDEYPYVIWGPFYSPDGKTVAFGASGTPSDPKEFIVVDNARGPTFDEVWSPRFSKDGKKVAFGARIGRELWWKIIPAGN